MNNELLKINKRKFGLTIDELKIEMKINLSILSLNKVSFY